jgi:NAD+ synthase (glutamine-hydrolysing)
LYPSFEWAYKKIERSIKQMGAAGTNVAGSKEQDK